MKPNDSLKTITWNLFLTTEWRFVAGYWQFGDEVESISNNPCIGYETYVYLSAPGVTFTLVHINHIER